MLFWMACEELKTDQQNPQVVEEKARLIYEDYISILSPKEVLFVKFQFLIFESYFIFFVKYRWAWIVE